MNCDEVRPLLDAYMDAELDLVTSLAIERHIATCADCSQRLQNRRELRNALRAESLYFRAPAALAQQIQASSSQNAWINRLRNNTWLGMVAALLLGVVVTAGLFEAFSASNRSNALADEVFSSHIRSLMVDHLEDVASTDQHTVKPWFNGKLDFSPTVVDLTEQGFPLIGGRLDYLDNRPVTALVYQRQKHIINLFVWHTDAPDMPPTVTTRQGYHLINWVESSTTYWAVSDLELSELQTFAQLIQSHTAAPSP